MGQYAGLGLLYSLGEVVVVVVVVVVVRSTRPVGKDRFWLVLPRSPNVMEIVTEATRVATHSKKREKKRWETFTHYVLQDHRAVKTVSPKIEEP